MAKQGVRAFDEHAMIPTFTLALVVAMAVAAGPLLVLLPAVLGVPIFYTWAVQRGVIEHARVHAWRSAASPWPQRIVAAVAAFGFALVVWPMLDSRVTVTLVVGGAAGLVAPMVAALLAWRRDGHRTLRSDMIACGPVLAQALVAAAALAFESGTLAHLAIVVVFESLLTP